MCQPLAQNENRRNSLLPQNQLQSAIILNRFGELIFRLSFFVS